MKPFSSFGNWMIVLLLTATPMAATAADKENGKDEKKSKEPASATDEIVTTTHEIAIDGKPLRYLAKAGTLAMKKEDGTPQAKIFFIAYEKLGVEEAEKRPITFAFNGGPGSSSVWLHLGTLGPRRARFDEEGNPLAPPYGLVDNEHSLLDWTDLVFIDPVSTGYSRPAEEVDASQFHGVSEDVHSVGEFIRLYTTRNLRWSSPKFLAGESYGTTRAAGLANHLQNDHGMDLNGIVLVSSVLDFQTLRFGIGNDLPNILFLPTYTATAWFHKTLSDDLQSKSLEEAVQESRDYALGEYASALLQGGHVSEEDANDMVSALSRLTGLSPDYVRKTNSRINIFRFNKELLRDEGRTIGRFDSRYKGIDRVRIGETPDYDPSYTAVQGSFTGCLNDYLRRELEFKSDLPYEILTGNVHPWNYSEYTGRYVNVSDSLREAMTRNPNLKVFVANGYYDLATPFAATEYTFSHLTLDPSLEDNVQMEYYEAGHMMYVHKPSLLKLDKDLERFYANALGKESAE